MTLACLMVGALPAQEVPTEPIGRTSATEVQVSGAVDIHQDEVQLGNGSTVTAKAQPVTIALNRGGELRLCSTTSVHLSKDRSVTDTDSSALMMALDRGAIETNYTVGKYSDVLLTPDLRILISGPGEAHLSVRLNAEGDTCIDNHGADAPYVIVSSQIEGGAYRVLPDQRVTFEHGSVRQVVDREPEPCGCPAAPLVPAGNVAASSKAPGTPTGGPSSTPADTAFPLAESEGLASPPTAPSKPVVPAGQALAQVTVPLTYSAENLPAIPAAAPPAPAVAAAVIAPPQAPLPPAPPPAKKQGGLFHHIGHFFSRVFGM